MLADLALLPPDMHAGGAIAPPPSPRRNASAMRSKGVHGRRINSRKGTPMHVMATYALLALPGREGNLSEMAAKIEAHPAFSTQLDWTPRPGTKTYPR